MYNDLQLRAFTQIAYIDLESKYNLLLNANHDKSTELVEASETPIESTKEEEPKKRTRRPNRGSSKPKTSRKTKKSEENVEE